MKGCSNGATNLSIIGLFATLSIMTLSIECPYAECCYAECRAAVQITTLSERRAGANPINILWP